MLQLLALLAQLALALTSPKHCLLPLAMSALVIEESLFFGRASVSAVHHTPPHIRRNYSCGFEPLPAELPW